MEGVEYYRAKHKYVPNEIDDAEVADQIPDIPLDKDDVLEVKLPINDDIQNPKGWLIGYNQNQKMCGYFPGPYVEHITPQMIQQAPQIGKFTDLNEFLGTFKSECSQFLTILFLNFHKENFIVSKFTNGLMVLHPCIYS